MLFALAANAQSPPSGKNLIRWYTQETGGVPIAITESGETYSPTVTQTTTFWAEAWDGKNASYRRTPVVVTINQKPAITAQPNTVALETVQNIAFSPASLSVTATGDGTLTYQWRRVTPNVTGAQTETSGEPAPGTNNTASYTLPVDETGAWKYFCVVVGTSSECGKNTVVSNLSGVCIVSMVAPSSCDFTNSTRNITKISSAFFATSQVWVVGSQTWSDAVTATECHSRTTYSGGSGSSVNVDCRNATNGFNGDYFSWCAVMKYQDILCPGDWRVPTRDDFVALDMALGGNGTNNQTMIANTYTGTTGTGAACVNGGGLWGGSRLTARASILTNNGTNYWSATQFSATHVYNLWYIESWLSPQTAEDTKDLGFALRCVKDVPVPEGCDFTTASRNITHITSASFATENVWTVGSQTWSDAVTATECHSRTTYSGNSGSLVNVDCRKATNGFNGDYFSWCAVKKYADILCPEDWRVPTVEDFENLHKALGGTGTTQSINPSDLGYCPSSGSGSVCQNSTSATNGTTGSKWGGSRFTADAMSSTTENSSYWSSSNRDALFAYNLLFLTGSVSVRDNYSKYYGRALRCVK